MSAISIGYDRFFHVAISGLEAEELLQSEPNGTFLVRESTSLPGESYALSVKNEEAVLHVRIYYDEGRFRIVPKDSFHSLSSLIEQYISRPMIQYSGNAVCLKQPLMSTRFTADCVNERIDCLLKVTRKANLRDGIAEEFERLHHAKGNSLFMNCREGRKTENVRKNRYRNVVPYDHTRIVLDISHCNTNGDPEFNDYINASLVEVLHEGSYSEFEGINKRYISTQGCLQNTVDAFWQMIWQENCRVIVMVTKEMERGRLKCYKYWPEINGDVQTRGLSGEFRIRNVNETSCGEYVLRILELRRTSTENPENDEIREVCHYQFLGWEDNGCPSSLLLNYMDEINSYVQTKCSRDCGPVVVHCSAGIGRTGTFIVLDILLSKIKLHGPHCPLDIFKTVRMVREQRATMVQTEGQYRFIYDAIANYMKNYHSNPKRFESSKIMNGHDEKLEDSGEEED